ncbi:MAG: carbamate kinase [Myxococcota bacterium]|nr:carbamate kinase [Myxococcota bacterium]MEE2780375.1 carbamate kinase [Myxococcota bacterium]
MNDVRPRPALAVVAVGGHALLSEEAIGTPRDQATAARKFTRALVPLIREGYRVLLVHGNGPQVGRELLRSEEASIKVPPRRLYGCVASTQGTMGYLLTQGLRNVLRSAGIKRPVSTVLTQVLVSPDDPEFDTPTKPVGPFYTAWRARELARSTGQRMVEDAGRGWRTVVPSPRPLDVMEVDSIEALLDAEHIVIAGGGGGIPVSVDGRGNLQGVDGVVDKDRTAALLANQLGADIFVVLTAVENIYVDFGRPGQTALNHVTRDELREHADAGQFPPGSMGPKVEAALDFLDDGGASVIITHAGKLTAALSDRAGTRISRDPTSSGMRRQLPLFEGAPDDDSDAEDTESTGDA